MKLPVVCVLALAAAALGDGTIRLAGRPAPTVRVAAVQAHSTFGDPAANRKTLARQITAAAQGDIRIVPCDHFDGLGNCDMARHLAAGNRITRPLNVVNNSDVARQHIGQIFQ